MNATPLHAAPAVEADPRLGEVIARATAFPSRDVHEAVLALLALRPDESVLELGFGSGRLLAALASRVRRGLVAGVDPSPWMQRHARRRCARGLAGGRIRLERAASSDLSCFPAARFDAVVGVHVACFFRDPARELAEIGRVMRAGGRLLLGFCPRTPETARPDAAQVDPGPIEAALCDAGFGVLRRETWHGRRSLLWILARR